ncbi:MAG: DJ-1/PfpI family protein [Lachnospiraceae bacterium]|nr:DJ-1/PfpI family protein [Lachnospiraceae bacterium]
MIYLFLAEGFEEVEALTTVDLLRRAEIDLKTVSISSGLTVKGAHNITVSADMLLSEADTGSSTMLILPGGNPGWKNLDACEELMNKVKEAADKGIYIASICAAPTIIGKRGLLEGKNACCYPGMEGALIGAKANEKEVNIDGKFITSRGVGTAIPFALAIIEELCGKEKADKIAESIVYKR